MIKPVKENSEKRRNEKFKSPVILIAWIITLIVYGGECSAQSSDQNFPTAIFSNELSGTIKARDLGDSRLTVYFYVFNGLQGDIFINVQTQNLNGDIDLFTVEGLKPISKIAVYADASDNETGRVVYLRKPEKILLRIEGRTPNDDPATFAVKFAGSFAAVTDSDNVQPVSPVVTAISNSDVQVNSVGTIIGTKPKSAPLPASPKIEINDTVAAEAEPAIEQPDKAGKAKPGKSPKKAPPLKDKPLTESGTALEINEAAVETGQIAAVIRKPKKIKVKPEKKPAGSENGSAPENSPENTTGVKKTGSKKEAEKAETAALANIHLIILFKDGTKIERPMSEVLKVGVDRATLTVITKDGKIGKYSILEITKFTIE